LSPPTHPKPPAAMTTSTLRLREFLHGGSVG
jgi:hypothetical protein